MLQPLLQILEDGRLTDGQGRIVDFKNTVIILTTNLGTRDVAKAVSLGFQGSNDTDSNYERMKNKVNDELKQHFRPEFLNRIDDTIVFHQLNPDQILKIVDLMVARIEMQLRNKDMGLELTTTPSGGWPAGWDPVMGAARCRTIQRDRGLAVGADPLQRAEGRPDRGHRHRRRPGAVRDDQVGVQRCREPEPGAGRRARRPGHHGGRFRNRRGLAALCTGPRPTPGGAFCWPLTVQVALSPWTVAGWS